ncbi:MAG: hypothetical protein H8E94_06525 [Alphaproteobacteria bacterium]|nr:hypothetical protein [Alphaproteobacteria bacterium]
MAKKSVEIVHTEKAIEIDGVKYNPAMLIELGFNWIRYAREHGWKMLDDFDREIAFEEQLEIWIKEVQK